jgi:hypothetical protein
VVLPLSGMSSMDRVPSGNQNTSWDHTNARDEKSPDDYPWPDRPAMAKRNSSKG